MGSVFEVSHTRLQQHFAVKFLDSAFVNNEEAYSRFRQEAEIAARLNHNSVVQVFDFNMDTEGNPFMVMELVTGQTLDDLASSRKDSRLERDDVLGIFGHLCEALDACHDHDIVHRDLKPSNIVVCSLADELIEEPETVDPIKRWKVKLLDFGISKIKNQGDDGMTRDNVVMGTPNYMSPEQAQGFNKNLDRRTDIFSLGAILYEVMSGRRAFDGDNLPQILHSIVYDQPPTPKGLPNAVIEVIQRAMAKDAADRYARAGDMLADLRAAYRVKPAGQNPTRTSPVTVAAAWGLSLVATAGASFFIAQQQAPAAAPPEKSVASPAPPPVEAKVEAAAKPTPSIASDLDKPDIYDASFSGTPGARMLIDEGQLYRADASGLSFWTDPDAQAKRRVLASTSRVSALALSNDGRELLVGQEDGSVTRWDRALREQLGQRDFRGARISALASGSGYMAVGLEREVKVFSLATGRALKSFRVPDRTVAVLLTRSTPTTLVIIGDASVQVIDADRRRVLLETSIGAGIMAAGLVGEKLYQDPVIWVETRQGDWTTRSEYRITRNSNRKSARLDAISHRRLR